MKTFKDIREDLASGRPIKKPVSSTLLKNIAKDNEVKSLKSLKMKEETFKPHDMWDDKGKKHFAKTEKEHLAMKDKGWGHENPNKSEDNITELETKTLSNYVRKAVSPLSKKSVGNLASKGAHKLAHSDPTDFDAGEKEDMKSVQRAKGVIRATKKIAKRAQANESARDNYNPEISDKRTKEKLKKAGLPSESPKVMEAKKPIVHSTKKDSLKMIKIKYNSPIKTKVTDIGAGGKEYVRKDWSEGYNRSYRSKLKDMKADLTPKVKPSNKPTPKHLQNQIASQFKDPKDKRIAEAYPKIVKNPPSWKKTYAQGALTKKQVKDGDIRARQAREKADIKEHQKQIVTNLDFNESLGNLVTRGLNRVRDSIKAGEKSSGYKVDPSKNNTNNPVSGKNIAKRLASQKKR